jgi:TolA-binding protein
VGEQSVAVLRGRVVKLRAVIFFLALIALIALIARPVEAQLAVQGAGACFAPVIAAAPMADAARDAELRRARGDLDSGRVYMAIEWLERARAGLGTLAMAYQRVGCRSAFLTTAERALALTVGSEGPSIRALSPVARGQSLDSANATGLSIARDDSVREGVLTDLAWKLYGARQFDRAADAFNQLTGFAPGFASRNDARLMRAQALLENGSADSAAAIFRVAADSSRAVRAAADARVADGSLATFARALTERRAGWMLWAPDIRDGRLLMPAPDSAASGLLRRVQPVYIQRQLDAMGGVASDAALRAMIWTASSAPLGGVRELGDSLSLADVRVARAVARIQLLRSEREGHVADAARYTKLVATVADSFAVTEKQIAAFADSLVKRDAAIALNLTQYRTTVLEKIATVRAQAALNRARMDSVQGSATVSGVALQTLRAERATAEQYVALADASASAVDLGLTRLPIKYQRDSVQLRLEKLRASLVQSRAVYDAAYRAAQLAEQNLASDENKRLDDASGEQRAAESSRDAFALQLTDAISVVLKARAAALQTTLERGSEAGEYGTGAALFFASVKVDSVRGTVAVAAAGAARAQAISLLSDIVTRRAASPLRARALVELAELLTRKADADYATAQRANSTVDHPDYTPAITRYGEFLKDFPNDPEADAAAYTLGSIAFLAQRYDDAIRAFERVMPIEGSHYRAESFFRHGDSKFELSTKQSGDARRALLRQSAVSYDRALNLATVDGDIYFLSLYKLGWSYYGQAERQQSDEYRKAVDVFARLVREVDRLPSERKARLALRQEAVDYLAIAITQLGGADEAVRYLATIPDPTTRLLVLRRVSMALRDQGEFNNAVIAYRAAIDQAPTDAGTLDTRLELIDLLQNRMVEAARAQEARLQLAEAIAPGSAWSKANAPLAAAAAKAREKALRESGSFALADARKATRADAPAKYGAAAELFGRYLQEFSKADSAQRVSGLRAEALFAAGDFAGAGAAYSRTATQWNGDAKLAETARRNATVSFDSALTVSRRSRIASAGQGAMIAERAMQDSLFAASDRFIAQAPDADARSATIAKGRRAAEGERWDVVAATFEGFAARWGGDVFAADARKLVGDARYRQGRYTDAQREWRSAQTMAGQANRKAFADSIVSTRLVAAQNAADSLTKAGQYDRAADSVLTVIAQDIGDPARAADALRNAVEVYLLADSLARGRNDAAASLAARNHAIVAIERLAAAYPTYQYAVTYSSLRARLLGNVGRAADEVAALQQMIQLQPTWTGRPDAMVRVAAMLDSLGKKTDAATAYEKFSTVYPTDKRAADAQYNAALIYADAKDGAASARSFSMFIARFPRDPRVADAQRLRVAELTAAGDSAAVNLELNSLCVRPSAGMVARCADRSGRAAFTAASPSWELYAGLKLVIATKASLTRAGVEAAAARKLALLRTLSTQYARAIASGAPEWIAAGSYQAALAQWQYGVFLRDVELPADLTDAQRTAAKNGSAQQAQAYFDAAIKGWQALVNKAEIDKFDNAWVVKARAALKGEGIPAREVTP